MTANPSIDPARFLHDQLAAASPDLLRGDVDHVHRRADVRGGRRGLRRPVRRAEPGADQLPQRLPAPRLRHPGRHVDVAIPKLRSGSYFPDWLLERRRRAERALTTVVATCYLLGVSTRRMEKLVETLGITRLSKSQVSRDGRASSTSRSRRSAPGRWTPARTRSSPRTRWC